MDKSTPLVPRHLDLKKDRALTVTWSDGRVSIYPIAYLRKMSPSADAREMRKAMEANPLTVLPSSGGSGPLVAVDAEMVGNYAIRIRFSDGHDTGLFSWVYLREIDPNRPEQAGGTGGEGTAAS
ncbi:gamma-butyrobetaine hydroxylase-like domain-containing protein [Mucisphaera sp.]|uniref:gamma-butyrobetaine hydroxylase-like domain-containing protein n=1 Tax=Mucisphaera sp. TaxID=2913024 RepID=UPI003D0B8FBE